MLADLHCCSRRSQAFHPGISLLRSGGRISLAQSKLPVGKYKALCPYLRCDERKSVTSTRFDRAIRIHVEDRGLVQTSVAGETNQLPAMHRQARGALKPAAIVAATCSEAMIWSGVTEASPISLRLTHRFASTPARELRRRDYRLKFELRSVAQEPVRKASRSYVRPPQPQRVGHAVVTTTMPPTSPDADVRHPHHGWRLVRGRYRSASLPAIPLGQHSARSTSLEKPPPSPGGAWGQGLRDRFVKSFYKRSRSAIQEALRSTGCFQCPAVVQRLSM